MFTNWLTTVPSSIGTPPPDIVIEVGPPPCARFSAHSSLLSAHSGYLRAAIRNEDAQNTFGTSLLDNPVFVPNITSEQFAPLLTYMYTGFLNLNIENIFGVLLATHVLHMPQALELCREFLTRTQAQRPFMQPSSLQINNVHETNGLNLIKPGTLKIVRPIASKATNSCLGFITSPSSSVLLPSPITPFKSLIQSKTNLMPQLEESVLIDSPIASTSKNATIDTNINICSINKNINKDLQTTKSISPSSSVISNSIDSDAQNIEVNINNKIIVDIASCDGPVRFRRVLNNAYGLIDSTQKHSNDIVKNSLNNTNNERSQHILRATFHQEMARNILLQSNQLPSDESENSEDINLTTQKSDDIFSCIYCKHTFKSQYCYIKHAKRHLNPLRMNNMDNSNIIMEPHDSSESDDKEDKLPVNKKTKCGNTFPRTSSICKMSANSITNSSIKREVRPLDMNVQYYPCKTCGCKFPSYYFVHKHRKLCHSNEENDSTSNNATMDYLNHEKTTK